MMFFQGKGDPAKQSKILLYEDNRVIVRIWTSACNKVHIGENVGHVSVEIPSLKMPNPKYDEKDTDSIKEIPFYVSLWPKDSVKLGENGTLTPVAHEFKLNYHADFVAEGKRSPQLTICLYSLKVENIQEAFNRTCSDPDFRGWVLIGGDCLINKNGGESCASLANKLLEKGGLNERVQLKHSTQGSVIESPDSLAEKVKSAKRTEIHDHPEVLFFKYADETIVDDIQKEALIPCVVL